MWLRLCIIILPLKNVNTILKRLGSTIKKIIKKTTTGGKLPDYFKIDGNIVNDKHVIANKFNTFFTNIGPTLASQINVEGIQLYAGYLKHPCCNTFSFKPIDVSTTIKIIDNLNSKYSFGKDGMSNNLLKLIKNEICESVTLIINQSLTTGIFPNKLKIAKVIPLFKKGDIYTFDNYRPISLLPSISKIFERTIYDQIYNYFQNNELFYNSQYGFRKNHSTELATLEIIDRIIQEMDKYNTPINIYIDLSKAFDTIDHNILLCKLKYYGLNGAALDLCRNYLVN